MADRVIKYRGEFDVSNILASLKQIRSEMEKGGAKSSLFSGIDKDIAKAEELMKNLLVQKQKGFSNTRDVQNFSKQFSQLDTILNKVRLSLKDVANPKNFKSSTVEIDRLKQHLSEVGDATIDLKQAATDWLEATKKISLKSVREELELAIDKGEDLDKTIEKIGKNAAKTKLGSIASKLTTTDISTLSTANVSNVNFGSTAAMDIYKKGLAEMILQGKEAKEAFDGLEQELSEDELQFAKSSEFVEAYTKDLKEMALAFAAQGKSGSIGKDINQAFGLGGQDIDGNFQITVEQLQNLVTILKDYETTEQEVLEKTNTLNAANTNVINTAQTGLEESRQKWNENAGAIRENIDNAEKATTAQENFNKELSSIKNSVANFLSIRNIYTMIRSEIQKTYNDIKELDKAFGQIAMVTEYSVEEMWSKYGDYAQIANDFGQTTLSVVQASGLYYQQGLKTNEVLDVTRSTMKLATLASLDFSKSTELMTAAVRGFHMEMSESEHVTDVYSEIAAHAAVDVQGLATAMSRVAAIANSAGMEFENTSAFLATMVEATQEPAESIGTALKTVIARFTELKNNVSAAESEFDDLDLNKVDKALKSVGVALKDTNGQFRNIDQVFLELSEKWDTLDRNTQRYIATIAAGSRRNLFIAPYQAVA